MGRSPSGLPLWQAIAGIEGDLHAGSPQACCRTQVWLWSNRGGSGNVGVASRGGCMEGRGRLGGSRGQDGSWVGAGSKGGVSWDRGRRPNGYKVPQDSSSLSFCRHWAAFGTPAVSITCGPSCLHLQPAPAARTCIRPQP